MELPVSKVKRMAKFDPDVKLVSNEGAVALTLSCEMFIKLLSERAYQHTLSSKKKTIQLRDFDACIQNTPAFSFLEGALETWADAVGNPGVKRRRNTARNEQQSTFADDPGHSTAAEGLSREEGPSEMFANSDEDDTIPEVAKRQRLISDNCDQMDDKNRA